MTMIPCEKQNQAVFKTKKLSIISGAMKTKQEFIQLFIVDIKINQKWAMSQRTSAGESSASTSIAVAAVDAVLVPLVIGSALVDIVVGLLGLAPRRRWLP